MIPFSSTKKHFTLSIVCFLLIPVITLVGFVGVNFIDPEWALKTSNYTRNFQWITIAKSFLMVGIVLVDAVLWLLTCFFILKARNKPYKWMPLALLGPFGLMILMMLKDASPTPSSYQQWTSKLKTYQRILYELIFFVGVWVLSYQLIVIKRNLMIMLESARTGVSQEQIVQQQLASSGMWAFSEGLQTICLVVLIYLLWPICFNAIASFGKREEINPNIQSN